MTLVVSDLTNMGFILVGDSAVTECPESGENKIVNFNARKILYSDHANIGVALWGAASVAGLPLDYWVQDFMTSECTSRITLEELGQALADEMNPLIEREGKSWTQQRRGILVQIQEISAISVNTAVMRI